MDNIPKTITLPWAHHFYQYGPKWTLNEELWQQYNPRNYKVLYACPLCGWYQYHPLSHCQHCRGKLERLGVLREYLEEWVKGRNTSGA